MAEKKLILIGRHGVKKSGPHDNEIAEESLHRLYTIGGETLNGLMDSYRIGPSLKKVFLGRSRHARTIRTGKTVIAGSFNIPVNPMTNQGVDSLVLPGVRIFQHRLMSFDDLLYNEKAWEKDEQEYMRRWVEHPDADEMDGVRITSFNDYKAIRAKFLLQCIDALVNSPHNVLYLSSHGGNTDSWASAVVESGGIPTRRLEDYGGMFEQENLAALLIPADITLSKGKTLFTRNGLVYSANISKMRDKYKGR